MDNLIEISNYTAVAQELIQFLATPCSRMQGYATRLHSAMFVSQLEMQNLRPCPGPTDQNLPFIKILW
jgi:hypothetical protein